MSESQTRSLATSETSRGTPVKAKPQAAFNPVRYVRIAQKSRHRARFRGWLILGIGLLPLVLTVLFTFFIATPMFSTDTRFAIRGGEAQQISATAFAGRSGGGADAIGAFVDGYAVRDFLKSRAGLRKLFGKIDFVALAIRPNADFIVRTPRNPTEEMLFGTYTSLVKVDYNIFEQIVVLQCYGFSPEDSVKLCQAVIQVAEEFANDMNLRARTDVLKIAETEVKEAEQRSLAARLAVNRWRDERAKVDPTSDVTMLATLISQIETQRLTAESQLDQLKESSPNSPLRPVLERQVDTLRAQIKQQRARLGSTGGNDTTAADIKSYEVLKATQDFADASLVNLRQSLEQARIAMLRQQRFVALIAEPQPNEVATYPDKVTPLLTSLVGGLAFAFFGSVFVGMIRGVLFA